MLKKHMTGIVFLKHRFAYALIIDLPQKKSYYIITETKQQLIEIKI